jgi:hypothetical protein
MNSIDRWSIDYTIAEVWMVDAHYQSDANQDCFEEESLLGILRCFIRRNMVIREVM